MTGRHFNIILIGLAAILTQGCGTGIDSTGRITAADVKREVGAPTAEETYLADIAPEPLDRWSPGKRLHVTDDRLKLMLGNTAPETSLAGSGIVYTGYTTRVNATGDTVTLFSFNSVGGPIVYTLKSSPGDIMARGKVEIPFTVEESVVESARERMKGNRYYVLEADRFTLSGDNTKRSKYIPVTVEEVLPGNTVYPLSVILAEEAGGRSMIYMNTGPGDTSPRSFQAQLSLGDPRLKYPSVTDEVWQNIVNNRVAEGMTREECRLALGTPESVDRRNTGSYILERWTYENGRFLMFEDGLLRSFRR